MAPLVLEGPALGHKHRNYNTIVKEGAANKTAEPPKDIDLNEDDVTNLLKVDQASANRNMEYILGVLKGNDMLYVSRALTRSTWLFTDSNYAHIINPEYLHLHLIPNMMAKAVNKLMLYIRLNLRDESRVQSFFNYYEPLNLEAALKWLPYSSVTFMEIQAKKYTNDIKRHLLKRLCEKSHRILEVYVKEQKQKNCCEGFQATMFLLNTHTDFYLDLVETRDLYEFPRFNANGTKFLMKTCPERIHSNFRKYVYKIHIPTFVKFLDKNNVRNFLLTHARFEKLDDWNTWINFENLQYFLKRMTYNDRLKLIQDVFVNPSFKLDKQDFSSEDTGDKNKDEISGLLRLYKLVKRSSSNDIKELLSWSNYLPFDEVLTEFKQKIKNTKEDYDRRELFERLTGIVDRDMRNLEPLLQYYNDNHLDDSKFNKIEFVHKLLYPITNILSYDVKCWDLMMNILNSINDIEKSDCTDFDNDNVIITAIIVHGVINKESIPEHIQNKFEFDTLNECQKKANSEENTMLFQYLYNYLMKKIDFQNFSDHAEFSKNADLIQTMLNLLNDWHKNLSDFPKVLDKIKELIKAKRDDSSKISLSWIYDVNKSWRKYMFEESIILCESERVCVNALKHDPSLLIRHENVVASMRCNDAVSLKQLLVKVRIYWADSIASKWSQLYREKLTQSQGHKALMRGLSFLLPHREFCDIINLYKPDKPTIDWEKDDEISISLRRHIAKNMHFARPQPSPADVVQYAKGDYLQFALPSFNAILYNLCNTKCNELIPKLLDSPVSLQKHVIRLAFAKMQSEDLQVIFSNWKTIKNLSIRAVTFKLTFDLLCKEKNPANAENIWSLLKVFIDELTFEEDKTIYELLGQVQKIPLSIKPSYIMKSYSFIKSLLPKSDLDRNKNEHILNCFIGEMETLIELMEPEFVANILQEYFTAVYIVGEDEWKGFVHNDVMPLMASYLCYSESVEVQTQRYQNTLIPLMKHTVAVWAEKNKHDKGKNNFRKLLSILRRKLNSIIMKNKIVPVAMFTDIQKELEQSLDRNVTYLLQTEWKLTTAFAKVLNDTNVTKRDKYENEDDIWDNICMKAVPQFGKVCLEFLKEDLKTFFPCIDEYFSQALKVVIDDLLPKQNVQMEFLKHMLEEQLIPSYLVAIRSLPSYYGDNIETPVMEVLKAILSHPSLEVKLHFYNKNKELRRQDFLLAWI